MATGIGSGVLIEGGYVVTNAHVVWPYNTTRVVFPDGSEFDGVQVKGSDLLPDWAVLGPACADATPMRTAWKKPSTSACQNATLRQPPLTGASLPRAPDANSIASIPVNPDLVQY